MSPLSKDSHWSTLVRAKVRADRYDQYLTYETIANSCEMPLSTIYDICGDTSSYRYHNNPKKDEDRGVLGRLRQLTYVIWN